MGGRHADSRQSHAQVFEVGHGRRYPNQEKRCSCVVVRGHQRRCPHSGPRGRQSPREGAGRGFTLRVVQPFELVRGPLGAGPPQASPADAFATTVGPRKERSRETSSGCNQASSSRCGPPHGGVSSSRFERGALRLCPGIALGDWRAVRPRGSLGGGGTSAASTEGAKSKRAPRSRGRVSSRFLRTPALRERPRGAVSPTAEALCVLCVSAVFLLWCGRGLKRARPDREARAARLYARGERGGPLRPLPGSLLALRRAAGLRVEEVHGRRVAPVRLRLHGEVVSPCGRYAQNCLLHRDEL